MPDNKIKNYDAIIIGSGQGGKPLAIDLAEAGWKTALIERHLLGGSCVNYGCTPTKTMVASARVAHLARRGSDYGVNIRSIDIDMSRVRERKQEVVDAFRGGSEKAVDKADNLDLYRGEASFVSSKQISIALNDGGDVALQSDKIVIDVGTRTAVPPIDGIESVPYLTSTSILELDTVPEHLVIIGGGYIGLEFGQMFRRFGSKVTIIQRGDQLLSREDEDVADAVKEILEEDGVDILLKTTADKVEKQSDGSIDVTVDGDNSNTITCSHLLLAAGRTPNSDALQLDKAGIEHDDRGYIPTNDHLETNIDGIWAIGDIRGGPAFTHISYDDYRILKKRLLNDDTDASIDGRLVPYTVFIDPQLGRVGLTETEAKEQGRKFNVAKLPMEHVARGIETGETRGFMKAIVDADTEKILGCAILAVEGGEVMNMLHIAMLGDLPYTALRDGAFAHPTLGESLNNLFGTID